MHKLIRLSLLLGLFFSSFSIWLAINEYLRFNILFVVVAFLISCTQLNNGLIKRQNNTQIESISIIIFLLFVFISFVINLFINPQPKLISNTIATFAIVFLLYFFYSSVVDTYLSLNDCLRWLAYGGVFFLLLLTVDCLLLNIVGLNIGEWFVFGIEPNAYFFVRQDWYSVAGSTGEPANAALTLLILFPFVLLYFNRTILQISFIILFIFNLVALMSTTGFVSFALVLFIFLFLDIPYKIKIVYVFGLICFIFVILYNIEYVIDYFNTIGLLEKVSMSGNTSSDASRMESYMMAIDDFVDSPLFGKGAGFGKYIKGEGYLSLLLGNYGMYGFLGATSFIVFFGCILKKVFAITGKMKLAFVAAFIPLTISACVSDMLHYFQFWVLIPIAVKAYNESISCAISK